MLAIVVTFLSMKFSSSKFPVSLSTRAVEGWPQGGATFSTR
jgi:hypothetical protein